MRKIDNIGLQLSKAQANYFVESLSKYSGSSSIFIRRFMYLNEVGNIDRNNEFDTAKLTLELSKKDLNYGTSKYDASVIHWIGYIYRYFSYVYEIPSKKVYKIINDKEMNKIYNAYHTMDPQVAIERILEYKNIKLDRSYEYQVELYKQIVMQEDITYSYLKRKHKNK